MPGSSTRSSVWMQVAERLRASSSQLASSWDTPAAVLSRIGHTAANASRKYAGASPSTITAIGIHDSARSSAQTGTGAAIGVVGLGAEPVRNVAQQEDALALAEADRRLAVEVQPRMAA